MLRRTVNKHSHRFFHTSKLRSLDYLPSGIKAETLIKKELIRSKLTSEDVVLSPLSRGQFCWSTSTVIVENSKSKYVATLSKIDNIANLQFSILASRQGIFPRIHHFNVVENGQVGIIIRDYIKNVGIKAHLDKGVLTSMGYLLRHFATMQCGPEVLPQESVIFDYYYQIACQKIHNPLIKKIIAAYDQSKKDFRGSQKRIMHGDFHLDNILYDGKRCWILDLEFTRLASRFEAPLGDVATAAFDLTMEQEKQLLEAVYGTIDKELLLDYLYAKEIAHLRYCFIYIGLQHNHLQMAKHSGQFELQCHEKFQNYTALIKSSYEQSLQQGKIRLQVQSGSDHPLLQGSNMGNSLKLL